VGWHVQVNGGIWICSAVGYPAIRLAWQAESGWALEFLDICEEGRIPLDLVLVTYVRRGYRDYSHRDILQEV
jgi:hypothetical protein